MHVCIFKRIQREGKNDAGKNAFEWQRGDGIWMVEALLGV